MALPGTPLTRAEEYLNNIATGEGTIPDVPYTRIEQYLDYIAKNGSGGGGSATVDDALSTTSTNPVQNKVINAALQSKGTYSKPSGGIPASDLAQAVQTSLGKADTAVQPSAITGMATQTYVQQQIAAIPDELPAVSSTDNGKFLRVVSGAWAAQAVPAAESASFGGA